MLFKNVNLGKYEINTIININPNSNNKIINKKEIEDYLLLTNINNIYTIYLSKIKTLYIFRAMNMRDSKINLLDNNTNSDIIYKNNKLYSVISNDYPVMFDTWNDVINGIFLEIKTNNILNIKYDIKNGYIIIEEIDNDRLKLYIPLFLCCIDYSYICYNNNKEYILLKFDDRYNLSYNFIICLYFNCMKKYIIKEKE